MTKEGFNFDFDERTEVPTFEEISSVLPKLKKHKKTFTYIIAMIVIIAIFGGSGFVAYKYRGNLQDMLTSNGGNQLTGNVIGGITGFVTNNINYSSQNKFGITIKGIRIDLTNEEEALKNSLNATCANEKKQLEKDTRADEEKECTSEMAALSTKVSELETSVTSWKDRYTSCNEDLDECEGED